MFQPCLHYIHHQDRHHVSTCTHVNKFKKNVPCKTWVKISKLCHNPSPFPREREGSLTANNPNLSATKVIRLNRTHSFLNLQQNFSNKIFQSHFWTLAKFQRIMQIPHSSPTQSVNHMKFAPFANLLYIMFQAPASAENPQEFQQIMQIPRSLPTQSVNHAKFAPFANILYIMFQMPDQCQRTP